MAFTPMEEPYTSNALVQFMYRDLEPGDAIEMAHLIDEDDELFDLYTQLLFAKNQLPKAAFNPSTAVLNNILQYSTKTTLEAQF